MHCLRFHLTNVIFRMFNRIGKSYLFRDRCTIWTKSSNKSHVLRWDVCVCTKTFFFFFCFQSISLSLYHPNIVHPVVWMQIQCFKWETERTKRFEPRNPSSAWNENAFILYRLRKRRLWSPMSPLYQTPSICNAFNPLTPEPNLNRDWPRLLKFDVWPCFGSYNGFAHSILFSCELPGYIQQVCRKVDFFQFFASHVRDVINDES